MAWLTTALAAGLTGYGVWERRRHDANVAKIPHRVHVNGTRGKSSVTRLIAGGLRASGRRTFGKTTGTDARLLYPNGREIPVYRVGSPNIIEQTRIFRRAIREKAEVLVIECMAVHPELQPVAELQLVKSTVGVITNARADHLDVMGPTVDDVAWTLAQTLPVKGVAFTAERERAHILRKVAESRGSTLTVTDAETVTAADLAGFSYIEHAENVALALAVCAHFEVPRETALRGMQEATPDPGVLRRWVATVGHKQVEFINAFAANDPDSTKLIWNRLGLDEPMPGVKRMVLANLRADRVHRSSQMAELVARGLSNDHILLSGEGTALVMFQAAQMGVDASRITDLGGRSAESVFEHVFGLVEERGVVVGIGNIVGLGEEIVLHFSNRADRT
ncbi:MAG: poly-gamma-glutamate synthase PgsB [Candidatus Eisenbacteria bacterium]|uniref:Poly-gamma-glutamate synthase PgsB n=1 Tax=Eiseniibacteriota bacterium TaxID=2212470 RepID=A0A933SEJ0_UNCEI|nr:poly-gamma-glutamate synthase PgsB [Candidatus Eisenbacteria bacterium]